MGLASLTFGGGGEIQPFILLPLLGCFFTLSVLKTLVLGHHGTDLSDCQSLEGAVEFSFQYTGA